MAGVRQGAQRAGDARTVPGGDDRRVGNICGSDCHSALAVDDRGIAVAVCTRVDGRFFVEHNKPATFAHPVWSWWADQKMVGMMIAGKMKDEVRRTVASGRWRGDKAV